MASDEAKPQATDTPSACSPSASQEGSPPEGEGNGTSQAATSPCPPGSGDPSATGHDNKAGSPPCLTASGASSPSASSGDPEDAVREDEDEAEQKVGAPGDDGKQGGRSSNGPSKFEVWERCCVQPCIVGTPIRANSQHRCRACQGYFHAPCALKASGSDEVNNCGCVERAVAGWASSGGPVKVAKVVDEPAVSEDKLPDKLKPRAGLSEELRKAWLDGVDLRNKARKPPGKYRGEAAKVWLEAVNVRRRYRRAERSRAHRLQVKRASEGVPSAELIAKKAKKQQAKEAKQAAKALSPVARLHSTQLPSMPFQQTPSGTQIPVEPQGAGIPPHFFVPEQLRGAMALLASGQANPAAGLDTAYGPLVPGSASTDDHRFGAQQLTFQAQQAANLIAAAAYTQAGLPSSLPFAPATNSLSPTVPPAGVRGSEEATPPPPSEQPKTAVATNASAANSADDRTLNNLIRVAENENLPSDLREDASKKIRVLLGL